MRSVDERVGIATMRREWNCQPVRRRTPRIALRRARRPSSHRPRRPSSPMRCGKRELAPRRRAPSCRARVAASRRRGVSVSGGGAVGRPASRSTLRDRAGECRRRATPESLGDARLDHHADRDALAVQHRVAAQRSRRRGRWCGRSSASCGGRFSRSSRATIAGLDADAAGDDALAWRRRRAASQRGAAAFAASHVEVRGVGDDAVLDRLGEPAASCARGQRGERRRVGDHERRDGGTRRRDSCRPACPRPSCRRWTRRSSRAAWWAPARTGCRACRSRPRSRRGRRPRRRRARRSRRRGRIRRRAARR